MLTSCRWLTSSHFSVRCSESTPKLLFVKRTPTLTINDEPGTIRALATCKSTHLCKSFNSITGVTPETESRLASVHVPRSSLFLCSHCHRPQPGDNAGKGMAMLKVPRHQQPILAAAAPHAIYCTSGQMLFHLNPSSLRRRLSTSKSIRICNEGHVIKCLAATYSASMPAPYLVFPNSSYLSVSTTDSKFLCGLTSTLIQSLLPKCLPQQLPVTCVSASILGRRV